ncbi:MFS transporter [Actinoallomurus oryzae]|uniref:MFS transporter n=1 Tax=Actinoallomurus oryzae TaxID=502180 RepID=UPI0031ED0084
MSTAAERTAEDRQRDEQPDPRQRIALWSLLLATFMGMLDLFIVNVAAPAVQGDLHASFGDIQFVIAGYTLAYAMGLVTSGRLGDAYGRRRVFVIGVVVFGAASVACAAAPGAGALVAARVVQGLGAALMLPQVLALIQVMFTGTERARAIGLYGAVLPVGAIAGQIAGGSLVRLDLFGLGWRMIFVVNVPLCVLAAIGALLTVTKVDGSGRSTFDVPAVGMLSLALLLLLYPLIVGPERGWSSTATIELVASAVLFAAFGLWERRVDARGAAALLPLRLFGERGFARGLPTALFFYSGNSGLVLILSYFLQKGVHLAPLSSGLVFVPMGIASAVAALAARRLVERYGHRITVSGTGFMLVGLLLTWAAIGAAHGGAQALALLPGLVVASFGQGLIAPALIGLVLAEVVPEDSGAASGGLLTATQVANALGVAVIGSAFTVLVGDHGYRTAFGTCLFVLGALALATFVFLMLLRPRPAGAVTGQAPTRT